jgi:hypothetical protein
MQMRVDVPVAVPAGTAGELLGERFGQISGWATPIVTSSLDAEVPSAGVTRTCRFVRFGPFPGGVIQERLTAFDPAWRSSVS